MSSMRDKARAYAFGIKAGVVISGERVSRNYYTLSHVVDAYLAGYVAGLGVAGELELALRQVYPVIFCNNPKYRKIVDEAIAKYKAAGI